MSSASRGYCGGVDDDGFPSFSPPPTRYGSHQDGWPYPSAPAAPPAPSMISYPPPGTELTILMNKDVRQNPKRYIDSTLKTQQLRKGERLKKLSETTCQPFVEIGGTRVPIAHLVQEHAAAQYGAAAAEIWDAPPQPPPVPERRRRRKVSWSEDRSEDRRREDEVLDRMFMDVFESSTEECAGAYNDEEYAPRVVEEEPFLDFPPTDGDDEDDEDEPRQKRKKEERGQDTKKPDQLNRKRGLIFGDDDDDDEGGKAVEEEERGDLFAISRRPKKRDRKQQDDEQRKYFSELKSLLPDMSTLLPEQHQSAKLNVLLGATSYVKTLKKNVVNLQKTCRNEKQQNKTLKKQQEKIKKKKKKRQEYIVQFSDEYGIDVTLV